MVNYICVKCNKNFDRKSTYDYHINKKFDCSLNKEEPLKNLLLPPEPPLNTEIINKNLNLNENNIINEENNIINEENNIINEENNINFYCNYCGLFFNRKDNLKRHIDKVCKVKKLQDEEKENIFKILLIKEEEMKKKEEENKKQITIIEENNKKQITELKENNKKMEDYIKKISDMNFELNNKVSKLLEKVSIGNINNGTINNVNNIIIGKDQLCNFGSEDITKIDTKLFKKIKGKTGKFIFRQCAENIFNNLSNNKTIYISDLSRDRAMAFENGEWKIIPMQKAIDTVTNQIRLYFKYNTKDAELLKDPEFKKEYDEYLVKYYKKYYDEYDKNDRYRPQQETIDEYNKVVNEELKRFFYDIRNKVQNNYSNIKKQIMDSNILKQIEYVPVKRGRGRPKTKIVDSELPQPKQEIKEVKKEIKIDNKKEDKKKEKDVKVKNEEEKKSAPFVINRKGKTYYRYDSDSDSDLESFSDLE